MEQVQVKIRGTVSTQRYGTLMSGDILRTDAAYAKFLVEECMAGEIVGHSIQLTNSEIIDVVVERTKLAIAKEIANGAPKKRGRKPQ